jgi:hypothetical protein
MKCEEVEEKMIDYLDNNLDETERQGIEKHLEFCERCLDEVREIQNVMKMISKDEMVKPDDSMRIRFYHMLHSEIKKSESKNLAYSAGDSRSWYILPRYRVAAGFAILICGTFLGIFIHSGMWRSKDTAELKQLHSEVTELKKTALFTMLNEESSSNRIQALNYADDIGNADEAVIEVLVRTLNHDKNVNVRMAAAYALAKFSDQRQVCDSLVKSLSLQDDPILQVTLINILVERKEKSALKPIQQIINSDKTLHEVKVVAENGVKQLI